jgi:hypothetical protein
LGPSKSRVMISKGLLAAMATAALVFIYATLEQVALSWNT